MAKQFEDAGAQAIELNIYFLAAGAEDTADSVEQRYLDLVAAVRASTSVPVAVKVAPYFSAMTSMALRLAKAGASGLVLFNRFVQPDIMLEELEVAPHLVLSTSDELRLALRWIAILHGHVDASLAATGGAHTPEDVLKLLLAGRRLRDGREQPAQARPAARAHAGTRRRGVDGRARVRLREAAQGVAVADRLPGPRRVRARNYMKALKSYTSEFA